MIYSNQKIVINIVERINPKIIASAIIRAMTVGSLYLRKQSFEQA